MIFTPPPEGLARPADVDVSDLTDARRTGPARWLDANTLEIPFDAEPTDIEREAITRRLLTRDDDEESSVTRMQAALDGLTGTDPLTEAVRLLLADRLAFLTST